MSETNNNMRNTQTASGSGVARRKRKKKSSLFWKIYGICMMLAVIVVIILNIRVWNIMEEFQASQPDAVLDTAIEELQKGNIEISVNSKFEDASAAAKEDFLASITGKELTYMLDSKSTDDENPIYDVLLEDQTVAKVTLHSASEQTYLLMITIHDWEIADVTPEFSTGSKELKLTIPQSYSATCNGIELGSEEQVGEPVVAEGFSEAEAYVEVPKYVTYEVTGLYKDPVVAVYDAAGNPVAIPEDADYSDLTVDYVQTAEIPEDISSMALQNAKTYMNYFSRDVDGAYDSTAAIAYMFPADSNYLVLAENYRQQDMWMYSYHDAPTFSNEAVSEYTVYSDELFSIRVSFTRSMVLQNANRDYREETNDQIYLYGKVNDSWVILNMHDAG